MWMVYSYGRLLFASWLVMAGVALQFYPSASAVDREARWRERQLRSVPSEQREQWVADRDDEDAHTHAYVKVFGVLIGGLGVAGVVNEAVYLSARYRALLRPKPLPPELARPRR